MAACRGKTALVTNATHAPARTAAVALAEAGAQVLLHEQRSSRHVEALVAQLRDAGRVAKAIAVDTSSAEGLQRLAQQVQAIVGDRLDVLVLDVAAAPSLVELLLPILCSGSSVILLCPTAKAVRDELPSLVDVATRAAASAARREGAR